MRDIQRKRPRLTAHARHQIDPRNPQAFDAGLKRRGRAAVGCAAGDRRETPCGDPGVRAGAGAAQCGVEGNRRRQEGQGRGARHQLMAEVAELKTTMPELELAAKTADEELAKGSQRFHLPLDDVPEGADEHGNVQRHVYGKIRNYAFTPKPHDDLGGALGYMDFEAAAKLSGARFVVLKKGLRGWSVPSGSSCSIFTRASMVTPRSTRHYWCATMSCSARADRRNSRTTSSGPSRASCLRRLMND